VYIHIAGQYILFRPTGDRLALERARALLEKGADSVFVPKESWGQYLKALEQDDATKQPDVQPPTSEAIDRLRHLLCAYGIEIELQTSIPDGYLEKLKRLAFRLAESFHSDPLIGMKTLQRYSDPTLYFANHGFNVAVYSAAIGCKYGLSLPDLRNLTYSALLNNIAYVDLPSEILYKPGKLYREEWEIVQTHPDIGAQLVAQSGAAAEVVQCVQQHHEQIDGRGYPKGIKGNEIHLFARICSIADVYDALTSTRPHQAPYSQADALRMMRQMTGKFDPEIFKMLVK